MRGISTTFSKAAKTMAVCPKCGTTQNLTGSTGQCRLCGQQLHQGTSARAAVSGPGPIPWERVESLGVGRALFATVNRLFTSPSTLFAAVRRQGTVGRALLFGLVAGSIGMLFESFWGIVLAGSLEGFLELQAYGETASYAQNLVFAPLITFVEISIVAGYAHLMLFLSRLPRGNFGRTFMVAAYAQAAGLLSIIPFLGGVIGTVAFVYLLGIGLGRVHETSAVRALLSLVLPLVLLFIVLVPIIILLVGLTAGGELLKDILGNIR
jgi:hypothetical protein